MKRRPLTLVFVALAVLGSCKKHEPPAQPAAPPPATATTASAPTGILPAQNADDLVAIDQGAFVVVSPESIDAGSGAFRIIDQDPAAVFAGAEGKATGQPIVIALPERCSIDRVQFDTATAGLDTHTPKQILVEMSDSSPTDGFRPIANVSLAAQKDGQSFPADANVQGRFVRVTVTANYGGQMTEIGEFRAFGKKLSTTPATNATGTYETNPWGTMRLKQEGSNVTGCFGNNNVPIAGGVEGHVVKFTIDTPEDKGPAIVIVSPDAKQLFGGFWKTNTVEEHAKMAAFTGKKTSDQAGDCPGAKTPEQQMAKALQDEKRLRLYGINFDSDSDRIRDESKPTIDLVAQVLKQHADWKVTIEGHTDSTAAAEHNQQLSVARANAVKNALAAQGIDAARLTPQGFGATKPVAPNDTPLGRAANRRVELVRM